ncbi:MAG TPA: DUF1778 domain-containing protein [Burkholderiaceae bacterium]
MGTTMAGFVRVAAKEKAQVLIDRETRLTMSARDFAAFAQALDFVFAPDPALKAALTLARRKVRRT